MQKYSVSRLHSSDSRSTIVFETNSKKNANDFCKGQIAELSPNGKGVTKMTDFYNYRAESYNISFFIIENPKI